MSCKQSQEKNLYLTMKENVTFNNWTETSETCVLQGNTTRHNGEDQRGPQIAWDQ